MKDVQIVMINNGENRGTYSPLCFLESFPADEDINEICQRFVSWDCNIYVDTPLYKVVTHKLPDWMTEAQYMTDHIKYRFAVGLAGEFVQTLNGDQWNKFKELSEKYQYFIGEYFKGTTHNEFKLSIRRKIMDWLSAEYDYKRPQPLSPRQFEAAAKYIPLYNASKISTQVYNSF